jgi:hypothetical protein
MVYHSSKESTKNGKPQSKYQPTVAELSSPTNVNLIAHHDLRGNSAWAPIARSCTAVRGSRLASMPASRNH